jgi:hypothetical protein
MIAGREAEMRRALAVGMAVLTVTAVLAVPTVAQAPVQTTFEIEAEVVPNKAGTPKNPQGVKIRASAVFSTPDGYEKPVVTHGYALFPKGGQYNGDDYPKCTKAILDRIGEKGCPKGSHMGHADATAYADNVITRPDIEIYNGGPRLALAYVTLYNPAFVQEAIPVRIQKLNHPRWQYKVSLSVPTSLQVVAGVPIAARSIKGWAGRGKWLATTHCPRSRRWEYKVRAYFSTGGSYTHSDSVPCRPSGS